MDRETAEAEAAKRERHKSKHMTKKRWAAVHDPVKGWHAALIDDHVALEREARVRARRALRVGDMSSFVSAASDALLARCRAEIGRHISDDTPSDTGSRAS